MDCSDWTIVPIRESVFSAGFFLAGFLVEFEAAVMVIVVWWCRDGGGGNLFGVLGLVA